MPESPDDRTSAELRAQAAQYRMLAETAVPSVQEFLRELADRLERLADAKEGQQQQC